MKKTIILISGKKQSGKTTLSQRMLELNKDNFTKVSFASPIKTITKSVVEIFFDFNVDKMKKEKIRPLYQSLGQVGRDIDEDLWVNTAIQQINWIDNAKYVIIDDVRFENEIELIKTAFERVVVIKLTGGESGDSHVSENALNDYDGYDLILEGRQADKNATIINDYLESMHDRK